MTLSKNQARLIDLAYQRSVMRLDTQQSFAIASDQRALVFAGLSVTSAALIFGATENTDITELGRAAAVFFLVAAILASLSALPQRQYTSGDSPKGMRNRIEQDADFDLVLLGICEQNAEYIQRNEERVKFRLTLFKLAVIFFCCGASIALFAFLQGGTP